MKPSEIKLGLKVKDIVSGFTGIITAKVEFLNGCYQVCVSPDKTKDGNKLDGVYFDIEQIEIVNEGIVKKIKKALDNKVSRITGGPKDCYPKGRM